MLVPSFPAGSLGGNEFTVVTRWDAPHHGGHPPPSRSPGSLGKGPGRGSPREPRESPAPSAWPLQDVTSSLMGWLGPRPADRAGNVRRAPRAPADGELKTSRSQGLGLPGCYPGWPGGRGARPPGCWGAGPPRRGRGWRGEKGSARGLRCRRSAGNRHTQRKWLVGELMWPPSSPSTPPTVGAKGQGPGAA